MYQYSDREVPADLLVVHDRVELLEGYPLGGTTCLISYNHCNILIL